MKKILLVILVLVFSVLLSSQDSPTKQDVEQCLLENMKECLEANILSVEILEIDSSIAKAQFNKAQSNNNIENEPYIIYLKLQIEDATWIITEVSIDKNTWMKAEELYNDANRLCKEELLKIERKKESERMKKEKPREYTVRDFRTMCTAIVAYTIDQGEVPDVTSIEELAKILSPLYLKICPLQDAWGEKIIYKRFGADKFVLISQGADRKADTADDISIDQDGNIKKIE